jgi:hypothetical protein
MFKQRLWIIALLVLIPLLNVNAAATVTQVSKNYGKFKALTVTCTTDGAGVQERTVLNLPDGILLMHVETDPGSPAPTDNYDLYIYNSMGVDIMGGALIDRDTADSEVVQPQMGGQATTCLPFQGAFTLEQANNAQAGAVYTIRIYYME